MTVYFNNFINRFLSLDEFWMNLIGGIFVNILRELIVKFVLGSGSKLSIIGFIYRNLQHLRKYFPYRVYNKNKYTLHKIIHEELKVTHHIKIFKNDWGYTWQLHNEYYKLEFACEHFFDTKQEAMGDVEENIQFEVIKAIKDNGVFWLSINCEYLKEIRNKKRRRKNK